VLKAYRVNSQFPEPPDLAEWQPYGNEWATRQRKRLQRVLLAGLGIALLALALAWWTL
jgi:hypothetical protein